MSSALETLDGTIGDDNLGAPSSADTLVRGFAGNDHLSGNAGNDDLRGGTGNDTLNDWDGSNDLLDGGRGDDEIRDVSGIDTLIGGAGNDHLESDDRDTPDLLLGGDGNDYLKGFGTLEGGAGHDHLEGVGTLLGGSGEDWIVTANSAGQIVDGGDGDDWLSMKISSPPRMHFSAPTETGSLSLTVQDEQGTSTATNIEHVEVMLPTASGSGSVVVTYGPGYGNPRFSIQLGVSDAVTATRDGDSVHVVTTGNTDPAAAVDIFLEYADAVAVTGGSNNDYLAITAGNTTLHGAGGDDTLLAGGGTDDLYAGIGNDLLRAGGGNDNLTGDGSGSNNPDAPAGADTLHGGDGNDEIRGDGMHHDVDGIAVNHLTGGNDLLFGDAGNDTMRGQMGDDYLSGGDGNDQMRGDGEDWRPERELLFAGNDTLDGDNGLDTLDGELGNDVLNGGNDSDVLIGGDGNDILRGDEGDDSLQGSAGDDKLRGGGGHDTLAGGAGADTLTGGDGVDLFIVDADDIVTDFVEGEDIILQSGGVPSATQTGTVGNDSLAAAPGYNYVLYGLDGNDLLAGNSGSDALLGGKGNDLLEGAGGSDELTGGGGSDTLAGGEGNDVLNGSGADTLIGGNGYDILVLADGFHGRIQATTGAGASGEEDTIMVSVADYAYAHASEVVAAVYLRADVAGDYTIAGNARNTALVVDNISPEIAADVNFTLIAGKTTKWMVAGSGDDVIYSDFGTVDVQAGDGDDAIVMIRNSGQYIFGGNGNDSYFLHADQPGTNEESAYVDGQAGLDTMHIELGAACYALNVGIENFYVYQVLPQTSRYNSIYDNSADNRILFHAAIPGDGMGFDGGNGNDLLTGSRGNDSLYGGSGNDTLDGARGNDTLFGSEGAGEGSDTFLINNVLTGANSKTIAGFESGTDTLAIARWTTNLDGSGTLADAQFLIDSAPGSTLPVFLYDSASGMLSFDSDGSGSGSAVLVATFSDHPALSAADILIVDEGRHTGTLLDDNISGNTWDEQIRLLAGNDSSDAGDGNDTVYGYTGNDSINGGLGSDVIRGGRDDDLLSGAEGYDTLNGNQGRDTLDGSFGNDLLFGGADNDRLNGGYEDDTLDGCNGNDVLIGGRSFDTFCFSTALDAAGNVDVIRDFTAGQDRLQLDNTVFTALGTGMPADAQLRVGAQAEDADDFLVYNPLDGRIYYDADGSGSDAAVLFARLIGQPELGAADFIVT